MSRDKRVLYLAKSKPNLDHFPSPQELMNLDFFTSVEKLNCGLSLIEINKFLRKQNEFVCNLNDTRMLRDKGFTILWVSGGLFWLLFDMDHPILTDFKRDFKLQEILSI